MKKIIINSLIAASALTSLTSHASVTIINDIKKTLPKDYGSDAGIFNLACTEGDQGCIGHFPTSLDINAKKWVLHDSMQTPERQKLAIYFTYTDKDGEGENTYFQNSCSSINMDGTHTYDISIDNSDPEFPQTVCKEITKTQQVGVYGSIKNLY